MNITVLNPSNVPNGPFTRAQIAEKLQNGEFTLDSLAFVEGLAQWTPLRDVLARVDGTLPPPPVPLAPPVMPPGTPGYSYAATMQPPDHIVYAGFWLRFAAFIVDAIIVGIPLSIVGFVVGGTVGFTSAMAHPGNGNGIMDADGNLNPSFIIMEIGLSSFSLVVKWLYYALQESSSAQATLGKRILGLKVTSLDGQRIGFGQATGRYFGKLISSLILCIGFFMAGFTERKQALHDMLASTLVIRN